MERRPTEAFPRFCVIFAMFAACFALVLRNVGIGANDLDSHYFHIQPLATVGLLLVALALFGAMRGIDRRALLPLLMVAAAIGALATSLAVLPPFREPPFPLPVWLQTLRHARMSPVHFGPASGIMLLLLATAALLATGPGHRTSRLAVLLSGLTLGIAVISGVGVPLNIGDTADASRHTLMSAPSSILTVALSIALIGWRHGVGWPRLLWNREIEGRTLAAVLSLCIATPVSFALLRLWSVHYSALTGPVAEAIQVGAQIMVSTAVLLWAWSRISGENMARREVVRALDAAPIALVNLKGEILHWSQGCERLYQWTAEEARGRTKHELLRGGIPGRWDTLAARLADGHASEEEVVEHRRDGAPLFILEQARAMQGIDGEPVIVLSMTDITARTRAEEALRASDARLALAVEAQEIGIFEWERNGDVLTVSPVVEALAGMTPGSFRGGLAEWRHHLRASFQTEIFPNEMIGLRLQVPRFGFRLRRTRSDGTLTTIEGATRCIYAPDGKLARMIGVMFDTSEREQRATALQARESELRSVLENVPDAMVTVDEHGRIRSFSATAEQMLGYTADQVIGRDVKLLIPEHNHARHEFSLTRHLETGAPYLMDRKRHTTALHRDGTEIPVEIAVGEATVGQERIFIGFLRDMTERLAARARLTELREELVEVSRLSALGEMAAGLAHELNQPLAAATNFLGAADMMLAEPMPEGDEIRHLVRMAAGQALRAGAIIKRMRSLSSRSPVEVQAVPLAEVLTDAVDLALSNADWRMVNVQFAFNPDHPLILADRIQIQQVIVNLVRNALEAMSECPGLEPEILIESQPADEGMVEIRVHDNGPGVSAEVLQRYYEPFFSTKADGMGIGLSICRRIVESHGGSFAVENRPSGGATIRFTVPSITEGELIEP